MADSIVWTSINLQKSASIGTVTKNTEMLKFAPDHLKTTNVTVCYYHVTYEFQSESTRYILRDCQGTPCSKQALYLKFK